jgi:HAMP domain-containing protein
MLSKADVIQRWFEEVWINGRLDLIEELYDPAAAGEYLIPAGPRQKQEIGELINVLNSFVSDLRVQVIHSVEQADWISAMIKAHGLKADTDTPVHVRWLTLVRIEGETIVESYPSMDYMSFFEQMGQLPENVFELLLSGTVLR